MKFNYFKQGGLARYFGAMGRFLTSGLTKMAPNFSAKLGGQLLLKPHGKRHYQFQLVLPHSDIQLETSMGDAHVHIFGHGSKLAIVNHGWADNSLSFQHLIESLLEQGYRVAAIDHLGHGKSTGKHAHLLIFIEALQNLLAYFDKQNQQVDLLIGHSMGALAMLNLPQDELAKRKAVFISTPLKLFELMFETVERLGISSKLLINVLEKICQTYQTTWPELSGEKHMNKLAEHHYFIHDKNDRYAPFSDVEAFIATSKAKLITTENLGHRRILVDTSVISNINDLI